MGILWPKKVIVWWALVAFVFFLNQIERVKNDIVFYLEYENEDFKKKFEDFIITVNNLDKSNIKNHIEFINKIKEISKQKNPEIFQIFTKYEDEEYNYDNFLKYLLKLWYFLDNTQFKIVKVEQIVDVPNAVPELEYLFWSSDDIKNGSVVYINEPNSNYHWFTNRSIWSVNIFKINEYYEKFVKKVTSWENNLWEIDLYSQVLSVVANEAVHSILYQRYWFFYTGKYLFGEEIGNAEIHEFLSDAWSFCVNKNHLIIMIWKLIQSISNINWEVLINFSPSVENNYSISFFYETLKKIKSYNKIKPLLEKIMERNQYSKNYDIYNDQDFLETTKSIIEILSEEDIAFIREEYINKWRKLLWKSPIKSI